MENTGCGPILFYTNRTGALTPERKNNMDFASLGIASVAAITVVCYLIGMAVKASGLNNKWIPVIVGACGLMLGCVCLALGVPDFPATDYITAAAVGVVSGLAATGIDQIGKQLAAK